MKRKIIELIEYNLKPLSEQKRIFDNPRYKDEFVIETKDGEIFRVVMREGYDSYWFDASHMIVIYPEDVAYIEDRIWDHIKA